MLFLRVVQYRYKITVNNHWFVNQRNGDGVVDESNHLCCRVNEVSVSKAARVHKFILLPVKFYKASKHFRLTIDIQTFTVLKIVAIQSSSSETVIFTADQVDFSTDGRELTPTMKMARHAVLKKFAAEVSSKSSKS